MFTFPLLCFGRGNQSRTIRRAIWTEELQADKTRGRKRHHYEHFLLMITFNALQAILRPETALDLDLILRGRSQSWDT